MRAILTLEDNSRVMVDVDLSSMPPRKPLFIDKIENDTVNRYNKVHDCKAVNIHLLYH